MATLVTTITDAVTLNSSVRGSSNAVTITGINDVFERIVTCVFAQETTVAVFDAQPYTSVGAIDRDRTKYVRVTNLSSSDAVDLAVDTTTSSYTVKLDAGQSHILSAATAIALGEVGAPTFGTLLDLHHLIIKPTSADTDARVEVFVALT